MSFVWPSHHIAVKSQSLKLIQKPVDPVFSVFKETCKFDGLFQQGLEPFLYIAQFIKHMAWQNDVDRH